MILYSYPTEKNLTTKYQILIGQDRMYVRLFFKKQRARQQVPKYNLTIDNRKSIVSNDLNYVCSYVPTYGILSTVHYAQLYMQFILDCNNYGK